MESSRSSSPDTGKTSPADRPRVAIASTRSRVTNGKVLLAGVDGRSAGARRYRDLYTTAIEATNGRSEAVCRRYASLVMQSEALDARIARGEDVPTDEVVKLSGELRRVSALLGLANAGDDDLSDPTSLPPDAPDWVLG